MYYHEIMGMAILPQYLSLKLGAYDATSAVLPITKTLDVLETWMSTNRLRLIPSKTQFI